MITNKNPNIKYLLVFIAFLLIIFYMYFYVINEKFTVPQVTTTTIKNYTPISIIVLEQLKAQIPQLIGISPSRVKNITYSGNIESGELSVYFNIDEASAIDKLRNQLTKQEALQKANDLFNYNDFIININGQNIKLKKKPNFDTNLTNNEKKTYFDNQDMLEIQNYVKQKYSGLPETDNDLIKYYKLAINKDFNIVPTI